MDNTVKHIIEIVAALAAVFAVVMLVIKFYDKIIAFFEGMKGKCPCKCIHDEFNDYIEEEEIV